MGFLNDIIAALQKTDKDETPKNAEFKENIRRIVDAHVVDIERFGEAVRPKDPSLPKPVNRNRRA